MDKPLIMAARARSLLDYEPETGVFRWRRGRGGLPAGTVAGHLQKRSGGGFCWVIRVCDRLYLANRLAWLMTHGEFPFFQIDHINLDPTDNRLANLRLATQSQNCANQGIRSNNTSGRKGVSWDKVNCKWMVRIRIPDGGPYRNLGRFSDIDAADAAYQRAAREIHGEFARFTNG